LPATAAGLLVAVSTTAWLSPGTFGVNVSTGMSPAVLLVSAPAFVAVMAAAAWMRRAWKSFAPDRRDRIALYTWLSFVLGIGVGIPLYFGIPQARRYVSPAFPLIAVGVADVLERLLRGRYRLKWRAPRTATLTGGLVILAAILASVPGAGRMIDEIRIARRHVGNWTLADADRVASHIYSGGLTYRQLRTRLHGPESRMLVAAVGLHEPSTTGDGPSPATKTPDDPEDLLVTKVSAGNASAAPDNAEVVPLDGGYAALIRRYRAWVRRTDMTICRRIPAPEGRSVRDEKCVTRGLDEWNEPRRGIWRYRARAYPRVGALPVAPRGSGYEISYEMPITIEGGDRARLIHVGHPSAPDKRCGWRIRSIHGVDHAGTLPGVVARLDNTGAKRGSIVISKRIDGEQCRGKTPSYPPPVIETAVEERALRRLLGLPESGP
jgi:hypothetical protein